MKYDPFRISALSMVIGSAMFLPAGMYAAASFDLRTLSAIDWGGIAYLEVGTSVVGYSIWFHAIGKLGSN